MMKKQVFFLWWMTALLTIGGTVVQSQQPAIELSAQDVEALRLKAASEDLPYPVRLEVIQSAVFLLMQQDRLSEARHLLLNFLMKIPVETQADSGTIPPDLIKITHLMDEGKYLEVRAAIHAYMQNRSEVHQVLSILALKADHEAAAFYALLQDAKDERLSVYAAYSLGIMLTRAQGIQRAASYFSQVEGKLQSPRILRWLKIDAAKFNQIMGEYSSAHEILDQLLVQNSNDAQALFWKARVFHTQEENDRARETLAKLIPFLYPDEFLVTETAALALRLNEIETAASILKEYEFKLPPVRDFLELFAIVRNLQNKPDEAAAYNQKAQAVSLKPAPPLAGWIKTTRLQAVLESLREERRKDIRSVSEKDVLEDPLNQVYLYLLLEDVEEAKRELLKVMEAYSPYPEARYLQAALMRREGDIQAAFEAALVLHQGSPQFRRYAVLSMLADYAVQLEEASTAAQFYGMIQEEYPDSYQARVAARFVGMNRTASNHKDRAIEVSALMSKFHNYGAAFVIKELMAHWDTHVTFARISIQTQTSPRKGLNFAELFHAIVKGTQYRLVPFSGTVNTVAAFLGQDIPVVYANGGMFASQTLHQVSMLTGYDQSRKVVYQESVEPSLFPILTEEELLEGICMAVYPVDHAANLTAEIKGAISAGEEYIALNFAGAQIANQSGGEAAPNFDPKKFQDRIATLAEEPGLGFLPLQLAGFRYQIQHQPAAATGYGRQIQERCEQTAQYWYDLSSIEFEQKRYSRALEHLEKAVAISPLTIRYRIGKARALEKQNRLKEAIDLCESLKAQFPNDMIISVHLIAFYQNNNETEKAELESKRLQEFLNISEVKVGKKP